FFKPIASSSAASSATPKDGCFQQAKESASTALRSASFLCSVDYVHFSYTEYSADTSSPAIMSASTYVGNEMPPAAMHRPLYVGFNWSAPLDLSYTGLQFMVDCEAAEESTVLL
ncbi:uncharacterized protein BO87DRAFT_445683, partial [Aspergillus neoniger CBS 115656]